MPFKRCTPLACAIALASLAGVTRAESVTPDLQINGFATAGASTVDEDFDGLYLGAPSVRDSGIDSSGNFRHDNVLGLQISYQLDEKTDLVGQFLSTGVNDYDTRVAWAYMGYRVNDNLRLRAGRVAAPLFMYSESIRVGHAYPWARLPSEAYALSATFDNSDGVDALIRVPLGDWNLDTQLNVGRFTTTNDMYTLSTRDQYSANVTLGNGNFSLRLGYNSAQIDVSYPSAGVKLSGDAHFADIGMSYDDGQWFAAAEANQAHMKGPLSDSDAAFVSVGHYIGKWLPYVMFGKANAVNGDECRVPATQQYTAGFTATLYPAVYAAAEAAALAAGAPPATAAAIADAQGRAAVANAAPRYADASCRGQEHEQTSYSIGFRYDLNKRTSLKLEVDHVTKFHDTAGFFAGLPAQSGPGGLTSVPGTLSDDDSTNVVTFNINATF